MIQMQTAWLEFAGNSRLTKSATHSGLYQIEK